MSVYDVMNDIRVEDSAQDRGARTYTHLIKGDLAPIGRVHLVSIGPLVGDDESRHFLSQMDADSNMGAKAMVDAGRRGPFRASTGRSLIMDRSAHVSYRKRGMSLEITILRGVTSYEMDTLIGKIAAHRVTVSNVHLFFHNGSRKKLGTLDRIDLEKLRQKIYDALDKKRTVGLTLVDTQRKAGILHKAEGHSRGMKQFARRDLGSFLH